MKITLTLRIQHKKPERPTRREEAQPEGNNFTQAERSYQPDPGELHSNDRPGHYGNRISLRAPH